MSACDDKTLLLHAYLDGELDAANTVTMEQHLKTCPDCSRALAGFAAVRQALASPGVAYEPPEAFRRRLKIALAADAGGGAGRATARRRWPTFAPGWAGWSGAGAAVVAACALVFLGVQGASAPLADELVSDHVRSMLADHLTDVATSNRHVVKPWFDGKVAFAPTVIDFADKGFPLAGGRLDYVKNQRAAALVYRRRLHVINVFVWPGAPTDSAAPDRALRGYNLTHWSAGGLTYWAVSDLDPAELGQFRDLYVAALKS